MARLVGVGEGLMQICTMWVDLPEESDCGDDCGPQDVCLVLQIGLGTIFKIYF